MNMNSLIKKSVFLAVILALVFGFAYTLAQQVMRQSANDAPTVIARDAAAKLAIGEAPDFLRTNAYGTVDLAKSLAPFIITFDGKGMVLASTATLNGQTPVPPEGVFADAKKHGEDRVTWQPAKGVRIAAVLTYYGGSREGFALAGQSLQLVENRASSLEFMTFWAWLVTVIIAIIGLIYISDRRR